ncbi:MAG TPA: UbiA family prenyltransferase [Candidatus Limnocylindrales bacterium]
MVARGSSTTSSRTSPSSSTSDVGPAARALGYVRLVHPFPSLLDGLATGAIVIVAGGDGLTALRLAASMFSIQASIGALNDVCDAPADAGGKMRKPVPAGLVGPRAATAIAALAAVVGLGLALPSGPAVTLVAIAGASIGYAYDLALGRTTWSWLAWAAGLPLLPVFAWLGGAGRLPPAFVLLVPAAVLAGTGLSLANALADLERDLAAGVGTVATRLGRARAWSVGALLQAVVLAVALLTVAALGDVQGTAARLGVVAGAVVVGCGLVLGARDDPIRREMGWEVQAVGIAVAGAAWLACLDAAGLLRGT